MQEHSGRQETSLSVQSHSIIEMLWELMRLYDWRIIT